MRFESPLEAMSKVSLALVAQDLGYAWPDGQAVVSGWTARLQPGLTLLVGGDGAGKTTRLRLLAGALRPQRGRLTLHLRQPRVGTATSPAGGATPSVGLSALVCELDAWQQPLAYRAQVFWCDPATDAFDGGTAEAYAQHHRQAQAGWSEAAFDDLLTELELAGHLHKPWLGLSMGMRRKLRVACALASGAPLTLLDDPLAALDRRSVAVVTDLLADCAGSTRRVFVSTAYEPPDDGLGAVLVAL